MNNICECGCEKSRTAPACDECMWRDGTTARETRAQMPVEVKTIDIKGTLTDAAKHFGLFDKDNQQRKISLEDILEALPKDFREGVRRELGELLLRRGN